jgi:hypothetical protein
MRRREVAARGFLHLAVLLLLAQLLLQAHQHVALRLAEIFLIQPAGSAAAIKNWTVTIYY